jgi:phosphate transport system permease protein
MGNMTPAQDARNLFSGNLTGRHQTGAVWRTLFLAATCLGIVGLLALLYKIVNASIGLVAYVDARDQREFIPAPYTVEQLNSNDLAALLRNELSTGALNTLNNEQPLSQRSRDNLLQLVYERVLERDVVGAYTLIETLSSRAEIEARERARNENVQFQFRVWMTPDLLFEPMSSNALFSGVRTALLGSLMLIFITILVALPIGVGAAIYLQEYATAINFPDNPRLTRLIQTVNRVIETNIYNLAGVPSIVYGMLGLAVFVRALAPITSGTAFGLVNDSGRTVLAAGLTMALLVLPLIIVNAQEAIKAVPDSLRQASYGVGATRWETIWNHVLPQSMPGILTGSILAVSRAIGETAPLIVVGASTFITMDPSGPFSRFTALPIQIYNWTSRPQTEFQALAAAAIIVLLVMLLLLNGTAIILRNRLSARRVL